jgi:PhnB protein
MHMAKSKRSIKSKKSVSARRKPAPRKAAAKKVSPVPAGFRTLTPYLICRNTAGAIEFYKKVFGAREISRMPMSNGGIAHAEIQIGDSRLMLGDEMPAMGASAPETVGGSPVQVFLYTPNVDKVFERAVAAGATGDMPPQDMFWGDRYAKLTDPFGHKWSMATHIEDVSPKEMARRGAEAMAQQQPPAESV